VFVGSAWLHSKNTGRNGLETDGSFIAGLARQNTLVAADGWRRETMQLHLTEQDIQADIAAYQARIQLARDKLATMPATASTYKEIKKLGTQRRALQDSINHVYRLVAYAEAARLECQE